MLFFQQGFSSGPFCHVLNLQVYSITLLYERIQSPGFSAMFLRTSLAVKHLRPRKKTQMLRFSMISPAVLHISQVSGIPNCLDTIISYKCLKDYSLHTLCIIIQNVELKSVKFRPIYLRLRTY